MRPSEMTVAPTAKVEGTWLFRGVQGEICRIAVTGSELVVLTERREQGRGRVIGPDLIEVAFPFGTLTGKVSPDGQRINWSNGEFWGR